MALFLVACFLPSMVMHTVHIDNGQVILEARFVVNGWSALVTGIAFGWSVFNFAAFANLALLVGWISQLLGRSRLARTCCVVALVLSLQTFQLYLLGPTWAFAKTGQTVFTGLHVGYFCWIASMALLWHRRDASLEPGHIARLEL